MHLPGVTSKVPSHRASEPDVVPLKRAARYWSVLLFGDAQRLYYVGETYRNIMIISVCGRSCSRQIFISAFHPSDPSGSHGANGAVTPLAVCESTSPAWNAHSASFVQKGWLILLVGIVCLAELSIAIADVTLISCPALCTLDSFPLEDFLWLPYWMPATLALVATQMAKEVQRPLCPFKST